MPDLRTIPDEIKWKLAAQCAAGLPSMYEAVFRPIVKEQYDELEQEVWAGLALFSLENARSLQLPAKNARDLAESMRIVITILVGPDLKSETLEIGEDMAVILVKRCSRQGAGAECGRFGNAAFNRCMAFTLSVQKNINPGYSSRFVRAMCMGDRQCEIKVEPDKGKERTPNKTSS